MIILSAAIILSVAALATGIGFAILGSKLLETSARQPEMASNLQTKAFIMAGLLDAVPMIAVGMAMFILFTKA